jgi:hypothetical protein
MQLNDIQHVKLALSDDAEWQLESNTHVTSGQNQPVRGASLMRNVTGSAHKNG